MERRAKSYERVTDTYIAKMQAKILRAGGPKLTCITDRTGMTVQFELVKGGRVSVRFYCRHFANGKQRTYTIGRYPFISLSEAQQQFVSMKGRLLRGLPAAERYEQEAKQDVITLDRAWQEFTRVHYTKLKPATQQQYDYTWAKHFYPHGDTPLADINVRWVMEHFFSDGREQKDTNMLVPLRMLVSWGVAMGYLEHDPLTALKVVTPKRKITHRCSFPYETLEQDLKEFFKAMWDFNSTGFITCLGLCFTLLRSAELLTIRRDGIFQDGDLEYVILSTKTWKEFKVPFTRQMHELSQWLRERYPGPGSLFVRLTGCKAGRPFNRNFAGAVIADAGWQGRICPHGFRTCGRQWLAQQPLVKDSIAELCLAHKVGGATEQAYNRGDYVGERLKALQMWNDFVESCLPFSSLQETLQELTLKIGK